MAPTHPSHAWTAAETCRLRTQLIAAASAECVTRSRLRLDRAYRHLADSGDRILRAKSRRRAVRGR